MNLILGVLTIGIHPASPVFMRVPGVLQGRPNTIKHLEENPALERWVQQGLPLHPDPGACEFCGNDLSHHRLEAFRAHFSKDLADHKGRVDDLLVRVKAAAFSLILPNVAELNAQFREAYTAAVEALPIAIGAFNEAVTKLATEVQRKADDYRKPMVPTPLANGLEKAIRDAVSQINSVVKQNNELAANFTKAKTDASRLARYHYVQQFLNEQAASGGEQQKTRLANRSNRLKGFVASLQSEIDNLQAQISQAQQGREKINARLASMLGSEAVQIRVVKDSVGQDRFQLIRKTGAVAKNMSDGERTAVAFSYFLTKLQEIKPTEFSETIVYIDDPISSLDANHIFQVTAAIRAIFFEQHDKNAPWKTTCRQLFISTHNFEFFNLLRGNKTGYEQGGRTALFDSKGCREVFNPGGHARLARPLSV